MENIKENQNYLITLYSWMIAPDGQQYRGVFGKMRYAQLGSKGDLLNIELVGEHTQNSIIIRWDSVISIMPISVLPAKHELTEMEKINGQDEQTILDIYRL